jgi:hypothetical protein
MTGAEKRKAEPFTRPAFFYIYIYIEVSSLAVMLLTWDASVLFLAFSA